jgi:hypothetical protein
MSVDRPTGVPGVPSKAGDPNTSLHAKLLLARLPLRHIAAMLCSHVSPPLLPAAATSQSGFMPICTAACCTLGAAAAAAAAGVAAGHVPAAAADMTGSPGIAVPSCIAGVGATAAVAPAAAVAAAG